MIANTNDTAASLSWLIPRANGIYLSPILTSER
jgi:hypothetical protein